LGELVNESIQLRQSDQRIAVLRKTSDHFPHRLLHWFDLGFHRANLIPATAAGQHQDADISESTSPA
jgi:hypothetical protein